MTKILVTGAAGFIGFHLVNRLLKEGYQVFGLDNINNYYDVNLKYARLAETGIYSSAESVFNGGEKRKYNEIVFGEMIQSLITSNYRFIRQDIENKSKIDQLFSQEKFDYVVNLAAQAGVRYSIENPDVYIKSNIMGFFNILEACRSYPVKHLIYASSSSVYGANKKVPFSENDRVDNPVSMYAATKKSNELMAYTYSHLYNIPTTGLRFFTVYGPWGRPDMSPILFADAITQNKPIEVFNNGEMLRDFTYIDDIIEGLFRVITTIPNTNPPYRIMNIGNGAPVELMLFIETMEKAFGKKADKIMAPMQAGDVKQTWADTRKLKETVNYEPKTNIEDGIQNFVSWYSSYYK